jgi:hypothetical protein
MSLLNIMQLMNTIPRKAPIVYLVLCTAAEKEEDGKV